ncbi:DUF1800 domain-containing protein [Polymorphobacter sp.]|uniref:DUF1800 domain-containing protein n=1 Tax=Polymorphobacter sp. TaxID=1909290 RepID=UPI003F6E55FD
MVTKPASPAAIALSRFGLGARPDEPAPVRPQTWLLDQLGQFDPRPAAIAATPGSAEAAAAFRRYIGDRQPVASRKDAAQSLRQEIRRQYRDDYAAHVRARLAVALDTPAPFAERLVHFWANHFAVSADKLAVIGLVGTLEFEAIRPALLGRFEDMLLAVTRHPAMLLYLDQAQSIGPGSRLAQAATRRGRRRVPGLNENLAREILELHTLGAGAGYTQADVQALAQGLTGWSVGGFVRRPIGIEAPDGAFVFQPGWHEPGTRTLLGQRHAEAGEAQGRAMLLALARDPRTARHLCTKLARHFVADVPSSALVDRLTARWTATNGDLAAVSRALVEAPEAWQPATKFKTPWDWMVSALRGVGQREVTGPRVMAMLNALGQPVWRPGSPAGWDDVAASWAAPDALMRRVETASRLAATLGDRVDARQLAPKLLPGVLTAATAEAVARAESPAQALALLLVSPEFLRRA